MKKVNKDEALKKLNEIMKEHRKKQGNEPLDYIEKDSSFDFTEISSLHNGKVNKKLLPTPYERKLIEDVIKEFDSSYEIID